MPDHVKKILNRAYLEDKPYNDIVLHLEREMRLNGLGAPDEVTLVPLNKVEPAPLNTESKQADNTTQNTKKGYCFYCNKFGHYKAECRKMKRVNGCKPRETMVKPTAAQANHLNATRVASPTKPKIVGMEPMLPTTRVPNVTLHKNKKGTLRSK